MGSLFSGNPRSFFLVKLSWIAIWVGFALSCSVTVRFLPKDPHKFIVSCLISAIVDRWVIFLELILWVFGFCSSFCMKEIVIVAGFVFSYCIDDEFIVIYCLWPCDCDFDWSFWYLKLYEFTENWLEIRVCSQFEDWNFDYKASSFTNFHCFWCVWLVRHKRKMRWR